MVDDLLSKFEGLLASAGKDYYSLRGVTDSRLFKDEGLRVDTDKGSF